MTNAFNIKGNFQCRVLGSAPSARTSFTQAQRASTALYDFYKFFDDHPSYEIIAINTGSFSTNIGGGIGKPLSPFFSSSFGENSWFVARTLSSSVPFDLAFIGSYNSFYSAAPTTGKWRDTSTNHGMSFIVAWHSSSAAWAGDNNTVGDCDLPTSPWKSGSLAPCRMNGVGGSTATDLNGVVNFLQSPTGTPQSRFLVGADDEKFFIIEEMRAATTTTNRVTFGGVYTSLTSSTTVPLVTFMANPTLLNNRNLQFGRELFGLGDGAAAGGISINPNENIYCFFSTSPTQFFSNRVSNQPSKADIHFWSLFVTESNTPTANGDVGVFDLIGFSTQPVLGTFSDVSGNQYYGSPMNIAAHLYSIVVPWSGSLLPADNYSGV